MEATLQPAAENQLDRLRTLADKLDCLTETDIMLLGKLSQSTVEAWRKRGTGPAYILLGNRYLYPRKAVANARFSCTVIDPCRPLRCPR